MPAADATITAAFEAANHTVTFSAGTDGTLTGDATAEVAHGGNVTTVPTASKADCTFAGWSDGETTYADADAVKAVAINDDVTFTATYVKNFESYLEGKIKAVSVYSSEADTAKNYAQLKIDKVITPQIDRNESTPNIGGKTTYADGILLATDATITSGAFGGTNKSVTILSVDVSSYTENVASNRYTLTFDGVVTTGGYDTQATLASLSTPSKTIGELSFTDLAALTSTPDTTPSTNSSAWIQTWVGKNGTAKTLEWDITSDVASVASETNKILYYAIFTKTNREAKLSNFNITATPQHTATFTVTSANGGAAVEGAEITIKKDDKTVATGTTAASTGVATFKLDADTYSYTITHDDYDTKTGTVDLSSADAPTAVALDVLAPTTIEISPASQAANKGDTVNYSAVVKNQKGAVMAGQTVTWSAGTLADTTFTPDSTNFTGSTTGAITVGEGATDGTYKVQASCGSAVAYADLEVTSAAKVTLAVSAVQVEGVDAGTVSVKQSDEVTEVREFAAGTAVKLVAAANPGYAFKGWGTTSDAATYESTNAEYEVTLSDNATYYAIFEFTGIWVNENFNAYTVTTTHATRIAQGNEGTVGVLTIKGSAGSASADIGAGDGSGFSPTTFRSMGGSYLALKDSNYLLLSINGDNGGRNVKTTWNGGISNKGEIEFDFALPSIWLADSKDLKSIADANDTVSTGNTRWRQNCSQKLVFGDGTNTIAEINITGKNAGKGSALPTTTDNEDIAIGNEGGQEATLAKTTRVWVHAKIVYDKTAKTSTITLTPDGGTAVTGVYKIGDDVTPGTINTFTWSNVTNGTWPNIAIDNFKVSETIEN